MQYSIQNTVGILWKQSCQLGGHNHHLPGSIFRPVSDAEYNLMAAGVANRGSTRMDVWIATNGDGVTINHIGPWQGVTKQQEFRNMWMQCPTLSFQTSTDTQVASIDVRNDNDRYKMYAAGLFSIVGLVMAVFYGLKCATKGDQLHAHYAQLTNENV